MAALSKYVVEFEVEDKKLEELETDFETELGWLHDSGIVAKTIQSITERTLKENQ